MQSQENLNFESVLITASKNEIFSPPQKKAIGILQNYSLIFSYFIDMNVKNEWKYH